MEQNREEIEDRKAQRTTAKQALAKLREIVNRAEDGEPVYAEMAARIEARRTEGADSLIREALDS